MPSILNNLLAAPGTRHDPVDVTIVNENQPGAVQLRRVAGRVTSIDIFRDTAEIEFDDGGTCTVRTYLLPFMQAGAVGKLVDAFVDEQSSPGSRLVSSIAVHRPPHTATFSMKTFERGSLVEDHIKPMVLNSDGFGIVRG
jgi:hypothetical protein